MARGRPLSYPAGMTLEHITAVPAKVASWLLFGAVALAPSAPVVPARQQLRPPSTLFRVNRYRNATSAMSSLCAPLQT